MIDTLVTLEDCDLIDLDTCFEGCTEDDWLLKGTQSYRASEMAMNMDAYYKSISEVPERFLKDAVLSTVKKKFIVILLVRGKEVLESLLSTTRGPKESDGPEIKKNYYIKLKINLISFKTTGKDNTVNT
ncbi:hypothetical protein A3Q56_01739 [Intoshia linei]|uniref:Uncharacterized protein n=1 Tax=Intoshia linei TaxID=1819745 RepID=A0A177BA21_9BILA|nr:hypothetical protein A3Q56_01739 [Intoshia linei]